MTKYAIQMTCVTSNITHVITNDFSNRTTALQTLEQKRLREVRQSAFITEQGDGFFTYKKGGLEFKMEVIEV